MVSIRCFTVASVLLALLPSHYAVRTLNMDELENLESVDVTAGQHANASVNEETTGLGDSICCAWKLELGVYKPKPHWDPEAEESHWDFKAARDFCSKVKDANRYHILVSSEMYGGFMGTKYAFKEGRCSCHFAQDVYSGGPVGKDGSYCRSRGALGGNHCKVGPHQRVNGCACLPASNMFCLADDSTLTYSLLFAPVEKKQGVIYNCGSPFDNNVKLTPYMNALAQMSATAGKYEMGAHAVDSPKQTMLATFKNGTWEYREKYGGQALAERSFCPSPKTA